MAPKIHYNSEFTKELEMLANMTVAVDGANHQVYKNWQIVCKCMVDPYATSDTP